MKREFDAHKIQPFSTIKLASYQFTVLFYHISARLSMIKFYDHPIRAFPAREISLPKIVQAKKLHSRHILDYTELEATEYVPDAIFSFYANAAPHSWRQHAAKISAPALRRGGTGVLYSGRKRKRGRPAKADPT